MRVQRGTVLLSHLLAVLLAIETSGMLMVATSLVVFLLFVLMVYNHELLGTEELGVPVDASTLVVWKPLPVRERYEVGCRLQSVAICNRRLEKTDLA